MKNKKKDLYELLQIDRDATEEEIKKAFRKLAAEHHPDKGGDVNYFRELLNAYQILLDPELKEKYDLTGQIGEVSNERKKDVISRDNIITMFSDYLNRIRCREDLLEKNILNELAKQIRVQEQRLISYLMENEARLDGLSALKGRFSKKDEEKTFFDLIIESKIEEVLKIIEALKFDISVRKHMLKIISEYDFDVLMSELKKIGQDVYPEYVFNMDPNNKENNNG